MVAGDVDIVADGVLSSDHGVDIVVQEQLSGVCLNGVACIHDQRGLGAVLLDGSCLLGHAAGGVGLVGGVIPGVKLTVGIAGGKDLQVHAPQVFDAGSVSSRDQTTHCGGGSRCTGHAQEITAGNLILFHNNSSLFCLVYTRSICSSSIRLVDIVLQCASRRKISSGIGHILQFFDKNDFSS